MKGRSLKATIVIQFLVILTPLALILLYQTVGDVLRATSLERSLSAQVLAEGAKANYKRFLNGVTDAVDSGRIGDAGIKALEDSRDKLARLGALVGADNAALMPEFDKIGQALDKDRSIATLMPLREPIRKLDESVTALSNRYEEANKAAITGSINAAGTQAVIVLLAAVATVLSAAYFIRRMVANMGTAVNMAHRIAQGEIVGSPQLDLSHDIGDLLKSLRAMNDRLYEVINRVRGASDIVSKSAESLSHQANATTGSISQQTAWVHETNRFMEEVNQVSRAVLERARNSVEAAAQTQLVAQDGSANMAKSQEVNQGVIQAVEDSSQAINSLSRSVAKVGDIIRIIQEIAGQTNLLALNAAIEAARAGEQGRGFAVVADEVRKLAERTTASTGDISTMLESINAETANAVEVMNRVKSGVTDGAHYSQTTAEILERILAAARQTSGVAQEIARAAEQQSNSGDQAMKYVSRIASLTEDNAGHIQELNRAAGSLTDTATDLMQSVREFKMG